MAHPTYRYRGLSFGTEWEFAAGDNSLRAWSGGRSREIPYAEIRKVRLYRMAAARHTPADWRCIVTPARGGKIRFSSLHVAGVGKFEDRTPAMRAFTAEFLLRAARRNPGIVFVYGMPLALCIFWLAVFVMLLGFFGLSIYIFVLAVFGTQAIIWELLALAAATAGVIALAIPLLRWIREGWPRRFDPLAGDSAAT